MNPHKKQLLEDSKKVLDDNKHGDHTIPAGKMYPHQWLWDSCFIAIGLSHYDIDRAKKELLSLAKGQWKNGMLPHMIFTSGWRYTLERYFWDSKRSLDAPKDLATSGITQPPVLAEAVFRIGKKLSAAERHDWYKQMVPVLVEYHQWLYEERDPHNKGVLLQIHPYETGLDNSPPWVNELHEHHKPWWLPAAKTLPIDWIVNRFRRDVKHTNKNQRINNIDALLYIDILLRFRKRDYMIDEIIEHDKYLVEDLSFNCIFIRANKYLRVIADSIRYKLPAGLTASMELSEQALENLWDDTNEEYYSRSYNTDRLIKLDTIANLLPLYSGAISHSRAKQLVDKLTDENSFGLNFPVPSVPLNSKWFQQTKYWQGPTWINTNWMIIQGLSDYGFNKEAKELTAKSLELIQKNGSYEYFSPIKGTPAGARNFSWTAALTIDLLNQD
jgi:hypothetical protein